MQQRNEKHPCMMSLVFEKCLHDAHGARCNISFSCSLTCCLLSPLLLPLLLPLPQLPACCIVTERWQEATCRYYCMAENSEANECNKSEKMKKDYNSNVHERMHVCMCARMCVAACDLRVFASLCADLQVPTRIHVLTDAPFSHAHAQPKKTAILMCMRVCMLLVRACACAWLQTF